MSTFTYKSKSGSYDNCYFQVGRYENGNLAIQIWSAEEGPITKVTLNPGRIVSDDRIVIKDYSENEGMVEWLKSMDIIEDHCSQMYHAGFVSVPVHKLTDHGREMLGI